MVLEDVTDSVDDEEEKEEEEEPAYEQIECVLIEGPLEQVLQLQEEINEYCANARNFYADVDIDKTVA